MPVKEINPRSSPVPEPAPAPVKPRIAALDGLRACAVMMVLVEHLILQKDWGYLGLNVWLYRLLGFCNQGVDVFFVLSGFLIGGILLAHRDSPRLIRSFYLRRVCRILPPYLMLILSFVVAVGLDRSLDLGMAGLLYDPNPFPVWRYLLFFQNTVMVWWRSTLPVWLVVTWSLGVEEQFYLIAPWLVKLCSRRVIVTLAVASLAVCPVLRYGYIVYVGNVSAAKFLLVSRADALCSGLLVACLVAHGPSWAWLAHRARGISLTALAFGLAYLAESFFRQGPTVTGAVLLPTLYALGTAFIILHLLQRPDAGLARMFGSPGLVFVGSVSYFVYLFHYPIQFLAVLCLRNHQVLAVMAAVAVTFILAYWSREYVERPLIRYGQRFSYD